MSCVTNRLFNTASNIANLTDPLEKAGKFIVLGIDVAFYFNLIKDEAAKASLTLAKWDIKGFTSIIGTLDIASQIQLWFVGTYNTNHERMNNDSYISDLLENGPSFKLASKALLLVGKSIETLIGFNNWGLIDLGKFASNTIGRIPVVGSAIMNAHFGVLSVVKDTLMLGSTVASAVNTIPALVKFDENYARANPRDDKSQRGPERNVGYTAAYKVGLWKSLNALTLTHDWCQARIDRAEDGSYQQQFWENRQKEIDAGESLQALITIQNYKVSKWETRQNNESKAWWKTLIAAVNDIAKILVIPVAIATVVFTSVVWINLSTVCLALAAVAATVGLAKSLYDADPMNQRKVVPQIHSYI